jgi:hypothetical protein
MRLEGIEGDLQVVGNVISAEAQQIGKSAIFLDLDPKVITSEKMPVHLGVYQGERKVHSIKTNFIAPGGS